jgi:hypothetical protein
MNRVLAGAAADLEDGPAIAVRVSKNPQDRALVAFARFGMRNWCQIYFPPPDPDFRLQVVATWFTRSRAEHFGFCDSLGAVEGRAFVIMRTRGDRLQLPSNLPHLWLEPAVTRLAAALSRYRSADLPLVLRRQHRRRELAGDSSPGDAVILAVIARAAPERAVLAIEVDGIDRT